MIRDFKTNDTNAVVEVWRAAIAVAHPFFASDFIESEAENLRNIYLIHAQTRVIEENGQTVGFIAMIGNEIGGLFLDPKLHGQGLGHALVDDAERQFGTLEVEVFKQNAVGRRFYDSYGFRQIGSSVHEATGETVLRLHTRRGGRKGHCLCLARLRTVVRLCRTLLGQGICVDSIQKGNAWTAHRAERAY